MSPFLHTQSKAKKLGFVVFPTLGMNYHLCTGGTIFCIKNNSVLTGSLYKINKYLNTLINTRAA